MTHPSPTRSRWRRFLASALILPFVSTVSPTPAFALRAGLEGTTQNGLEESLDVPTGARSAVSAAPRPGSEEGALGVEPAIFASLFDHTNLDAKATKSQIQKTAGETLDRGYALVAVRPKHALWAAEVLSNSRVKVGPAIGFERLTEKYDGTNMTRAEALARYDLPIEAKQREITEVIQALRRKHTSVGVEIDFVINVKRLLDGDEQYVENEIKTLIQTVRDLEDSGEHVAYSLKHIVVKVIGENVFLNAAQKRKVYGWAKQYGADFVKTSTGFAHGGATEADLKLMRQVVGSKMGIKAAGGIRTLEDALKMIRAAAPRRIDPSTIRLGASASVAIDNAYRKAYPASLAPGKGKLPPDGLHSQTSFENRATFVNVHMDTWPYASTPKSRRDYLDYLGKEYFEWRVQPTTERNVASIATIVAIDTLPKDEEGNQDVEAEPRVKKLIYVHQGTDTRRAYQLHQQAAWALDYLEHAGGASNPTRIREVLDPIFGSPVLAPNPAAPTGGSVLATEGTGSDAPAGLEETKSEPDNDELHNLEEYERRRRPSSPGPTADDLHNPKSGAGLEEVEIVTAEALATHPALAPVAGQIATDAAAAVVLGKVVVYRSRAIADAVATVLEARPSELSQVSFTPVDWIAGMHPPSRAVILYDSSRKEARPVAVPETTVLVDLATLPEDPTEAFAAFIQQALAAWTGLPIPGYQVLRLPDGRTAIFV